MKIFLFMLNWKCNIIKYYCYIFHRCSLIQVTSLYVWKICFSVYNTIEKLRAKPKVLFRFLLKIRFRLDTGYSSSFTLLELSRKKNLLLTIFCPCFFFKSTLLTIYVKSFGGYIHVWTKKILQVRTNQLSWVYTHLKGVKIMWKRKMDLALISYFDVIKCENYCFSTKVLIKVTFIISPDFSW